MYNARDAKHIKRGEVMSMHAHTIECPKATLDAIDDA